MVFISYNKRDKEAAMLLANAFEEFSEPVFYDEWDIRPGNSIIQGVEKGLCNSDIFIIIWSKHSSESEWVELEINTYLIRRLKDKTLRIIPIMLDNTPLPVFLSDFKGISCDYKGDLHSIVSNIIGNPNDLERLKRMQIRLKAHNEHCRRMGNTVQYVICPECESEKLEISSASHDGDTYVTIECKECKWLTTEEL
ncbi:MAG: toll/interleukin-1 receptor domain-containing protein [Chlorobium sp.]|nr:toll/interleukin-1 receptor domain-containing protein [Chlorobium sp.]